MPAETDIVDAIRDNATAPASMAGDGQSVTEHSLTDQIAAAKFVAAQAAVSGPTFGILFSKIIPPGVGQ
jgi:hypothetical protein